VVGRIGIDDVAPVVSGGRFPAKAVVGEVVPVSATVWREGHDAVSATLVVRYHGTAYPRLTDDPPGRVKSAAAIPISMPLYAVYTGLSDGVGLGTAVPAYEGITRTAAVRNKSEINLILPILILHGAQADS